MSQLLFGPDVLPSLHMTVDLINTAAHRNGEELLNTTDDLNSLGREGEIYYRPEGTRAEVLALRGLRARLEAAILAEQEARFGILNELFFGASAIPQIVTHEGDPRPHFHYTLEDAPYPQHIMGITAYALSRLTIMDEFDRLRTCEGEGCNKIFFDQSKNGGRLYCDSQTCGNRTHAAKYRARKSQSIADPS